MPATTLHDPTTERCTGNLTRCAAAACLTALLAAAGCDGLFGDGGADGTGHGSFDEAASSALYSPEEDAPEDVRDPFEFDPEAAEAEEPVLVEDDAGLLEDARVKRRGELEEAVSDLELVSVLLGSTPLANVNGRIVRVGDRLSAGDTEFRVRAIDTDRVTLVAEDRMLGMTEADGTAFEGTLTVQRAALGK